MFNKTTHAAAIFLLSSMLGPMAYAGELLDVTIKTVSLDKNQNAAVIFVDDIDDIASCASAAYGTKQFRFDASTTGGKKLLEMAIQAKVNSKNVRAYGTDACITLSSIQYEELNKLDIYN